MSANIIVTNLNGESREVEIQTGMSLMEHLREAGYEEILAMCGGCCSCATCHVHIAEDQMTTLSPVEEDEEMLLMMADDYEADRSRLSCQVELGPEQAGLKVQLIEVE